MGKDGFLYPIPQERIRESPISFINGVKCRPLGLDSLSPWFYRSAFSWRVLNSIVNGAGFCLKVSIRNRSDDYEEKSEDFERIQGSL